MIAIAASLTAFLLGLSGPKFWWRGVTWLVASILAIGSAATALAAQSAEVQGMTFVITPASFMLGLFAQMILGAAFYGGGVALRTTLSARRGTPTHDDQELSTQAVD